MDAIIASESAAQRGGARRWVGGADSVRMFLSSYTESTCWKSVWIGTGVAAGRGPVLLVLNQMPKKSVSNSRTTGT